MKRKILILLLASVVGLSFNLTVPALPALAQITYGLVVTTTTGGSVTSPGQGVFTTNPGTTVSLVAVPDPGYRFLYWTGEVATVANVNAASTTIIMNRDYTITANFAITTYNITTIGAANGTIAPSGVVTVNYGGGQPFTIIPNPGYHIVDVQVDRQSVGAVSVYAFTNVTGDHTITAIFSVNTYTITPSVVANGSISLSGAVSANLGDSQTFTITPNPGYHVVDVLVDGATAGPVASYTFKNVSASHTIAATFALNTYTITPIAGSNGSISPSGVVTINHGGNQTYTITPNTGYHVASVTVDGASVGAVSSYTFNKLESNHTIAVQFAANDFTLTTAAGANGSIWPVGSITVNHGDEQTIVITPDIAYRVADVMVDGVSVGAVSSYKLSKIDSNHTVVATFVIGWVLYVMLAVVIALVFPLGFWLGKRVSSPR